MDTKEMAMNRDTVIIRTSLIGIGANVLLAAGKAAVGLLSGSIAVVLDAVNNLSDALSSFITIIGTKLAGRQPDKLHPYGYGRIEYLSAAIISAIVLYAGVTALVESFKKIISPEAPDYTPVTLIVLVMGIAVKLLLGSYVKKTGEKVNSGALVASGEDARNDAVLSASVLASALIFMFTGASLEAYVGLVISLMIVKSGFEMMKDTIDDLLGKRVDRELSLRVKETAASDPLAHGAYDLILNSYGPNRLQGSVHVEVDDDITAIDIDAMTRRIQEAVFRKHQVILTAVGVYAVDRHDDEVSKMRGDITRKVMSHDGVLQMHGFHMNKERKLVTFDIIIDFAEDRRAIYNEILEEIRDMYPEWQISITLDSDISD